MSLTTTSPNVNRNSQTSSGTEIVGVIGVAPRRSRTLLPGPDVWTATQRYAALVSDRIPLRARCLRLPHVDAVVARILGLPSRVRAVVVVGTGPSESAKIQRAVAGLKGPPVISETDLVTAALGAATIGTLRSHGVRLRRGRIVVTHSEVLPRLGPLFATGGGILTSWTERDAQTAALRDVMVHNDILIDLAGVAPDDCAPGRTLRLPHEPFDYAGLVLPGLLSSLGRRAYVSVTTDVLAACARALARLSSPDRTLPALDESLVVPAVAREVARTLGDRPTHHPYRRPGVTHQPFTHHRHPEGQRS